jgi:NAD(P)-dependent dehydrogenase (short-subunit alcohol dehydrogenase family)
VNIQEFIVIYTDTINQTDAGIDAGKLTPDGKNADEMKKNLFDEDRFGKQQHALHQAKLIPIHSFDTWSDLYTTNVIGPHFLSVAFLPLLQKATERTHGWSSTIINISSISGLVRISQGHFNYNASKAATVHLNKMLACEVQSSGLKIRVNAIAPGVFPTEMTTGESKGDQKSEMEKEHKGDLPSQRPGKDRGMFFSFSFFPFPIANTCFLF